MKFALRICMAAILFAATSASAQTVLKKQSDGTRRYVPISWQNAALVDANEATFRLARAQTERTQGAKPLSSESTGAEAQHRYWQRQEKLRVAVEQAQRRSNQTARSSERAGRK